MLALPNRASRAATLTACRQHSSTTSAKFGCNMPVFSPSADLASASNHNIRSILLLDDDVDLADSLKSTIEAHNFVVSVAHNGVEGLREILSMDFDVVICDMMMPTMPGDMFYLAVKKMKPAMCERFLFITGHGGDDRVNHFLHHNNGIAVFKPVPAEELLQMITFVIQRNERKQLN
jgi:DNA-binding response OmpR family regulator